MPVSMSGIRSTSAILVPQGGTGNNSLNSGSLLVGNGTEAISSIPPGSEGQVLSVVNGEWAPANATGGAGGLSTVNTNGNIEGDGSSGSPVTLKTNISLTSVTASFSGDGSGITGLTAGQVSGIISSVSSSGNLQGDGTSGNPLTLKNNISLTSVTASFSGSGAGLTGIPNSALQNNSININGENVPLGGLYILSIPSSVTNFVDPSQKTFTGSAAGIVVGQVVALSGTLVVADNSNNLRSNVIGVATNVSGTTVTVQTFGEATVSGATLYPALGSEMYLGSNGVVTAYNNVGSGKYATQVGFISDSGKIILQPRVYGQKA